jgi:tetratricopeptide (TPR) repeat protein
VRSFIFTQRHGVPSDGLPNFTLAGFTSGNASVHPGSEAGKKVTDDLFQRICEKGEALALSDVKTARKLCRSAFGVMRSRMEANTASRWTSYGEYVRYGIRVATLAKHLTEPRWTYADRAYAKRLESDEAVLYADELAWLYNDVGLSLCSEGYMADAYSVWEQGFEIDRVTDSEDEGGQYIVQSRLHMSHVFLELGRLREAAEYLEATERANASYKDIDFRARIEGYRGLLEHLTGNLEEADRLYRRAVRVLQRGHNIRAESIFTRHWADLMLSRDDTAEAGRLARRAYILAIEGNFPDLELFARKAQAHVLRAQRKFPQAQSEYFIALEGARARGIRRLQSDILSELARLALDIGDWETARWRAMSSLMLANEMSLGLRCTHGLVILGLATLQSGDRDLARQYLHAARDMANQQGYYLRGREAELELQRLGME